MCTACYLSCVVCWLLCVSGVVSCLAFVLGLSYVLFGASCVLCVVCSYRPFCSVLAVVSYLLFAVCGC